MGTLAYDLGNSYQYSQFASFFELITRAELPTSDRCFARATPDVLESALWHVERTMAMLPQTAWTKPDFGPDRLPQKTCSR